MSNQFTDRAASQTIRVAGFALLVLLMSVNADRAGAQNDSITLVSGRPVRGAIKNVQPNAITVATSDAEMEVDPWNIRRIKFDDEPNELTRAKTGYVDGRLNVCLDELDRIGQAPAREIIQQEIDFYRAMASARTALAGGEISTNQAISLVSQFIRDNAESFHYIPAVDMLGNLTMAAGKFDEASQQFEMVAQSPWPELSFQALLNRGRATLRQGNYDEAIAAFQQIESADRAEDYALQTKLIARCLRAQALGLSGQHDEGIKIAEQIIDKESSDNQAVFAYAYNALGACYKQKNEIKRALHAYLHTDLLFFTESEAHAEALYELQELWSQLNRTDMAGEARQKIKNRYRNTYWASKVG